MNIFVRARKSPWIETDARCLYNLGDASGLVRARGLKRVSMENRRGGTVSGLVRARGLKPTDVLAVQLKHRQGS